MHSRTSTAAPAGVPVQVETILLGATAGRLTYRLRSGALRGREHPDDRALALSGLGRDGHGSPVGVLLHSTSWRFGPTGVVLTYAALPDPDPGGAVSLVAPPDFAGSTDGRSPSPDLILPEHVVVHACRHLAWLHRNDPLVRALADGQPRLWDLIDRYPPAPAGSP
jgi:hypothetical protein